MKIFKSKYQFSIYFLLFQNAEKLPLGQLPIYQTATEVKSALTKG
jgi:hypothetical protein